MNVVSIRIRTALFCAVVLGSVHCFAGDDLPRRGLMGVQLAPVNDSIKESLGLESAKGALITVVMPDTAAQKAGLQGNDILLRVGDTDVTDLQGTMRALRTYYAGDTLKLSLLRNKESVTAELTLAPRPKESSPDYEVVYGSFGEKGGRVRTIVTRPKGDGKAPAVLFVQGPAPFPMDFAVFPQHPFKGLVEQLTKAGFVVMRVERPGVGDSEGADVQTVRVKQDVTVFKDALKKLKSLEFVDGGQLFLLGHSGGSTLTPMIAQDEALKGVITYAAFSRPLVEQSVEAGVRRWKFELLNEDEIKSNSEKLARFLKACYVDRQSPMQIFAKYPDLKEFVSPLLQGETLIEGIHYEYWQELAALNLSELWAKVDAPVLAIWGEADFVVGKADSEQIVSLVNRTHPNRATLVTIAGADHMYNKAEDQEESFLAGGRGSYNPAVIEAAEKWMKARLSPK